MPESLSVKKMFKKNKKGFSLMELIIVMFIFAVVMGVVAAIFGKLSTNFRNTRAIQANLEKAQQAMNLLAKVLRTSDIIGCPAKVGYVVPVGEDPCLYEPNQMRVYDFSQSACIIYSFNANKLRAAEVSARNADACRSMPLNAFNSSFKNIIETNGVRNGFFRISKTSWDINEPQVGKVTIVMDVCGFDCAAWEGTKIQSSVSLRNFPLP